MKKNKYSARSDVSLFDQNKVLIQDFVKGNPVSELKISNIVKRSGKSKANYLWPGPRAHLTLLVPISDFAENAKCLKLPRFYRLLMFQCATQICGHFLFCTQCQFPNFSFLVLKIDWHSQLYFHHFYRIRPCAIMAWLGNKLQNEIEPIIRDFIDCMEPGTPRVEIESYRREDSCQVFIHFKKSLSEKHSLFKTGFKISSENDVRYL